jgi:hypothetical protein
VNLRQLAQSDVSQGIIVKANVVAIYDHLMSFALVPSMPLALPFNVDVSLHVQPPPDPMRNPHVRRQRNANRRVQIVLSVRPKWRFKV